MSIDAMKTLITAAFIILLSGACFAHAERWDENRLKWSPLMYAIYNGQKRTAIKLIKRDANLNYDGATNHHWYLTALTVALFMNREWAVKRLLATKAIDSPNKYLMIACGQKSAINLDRLINYGANPNATLDNGYSPLMAATSFGTDDILACLIKHKANIEQTRKIDGINALMLAACSGSVAKVRLLLAAGANKYAKDNKGRTALSYVDEIYEWHKTTEKAKETLRAMLR